MSTEAHRPRGLAALSREEIELMVALAWNDEGLRRGLRPLAWQMGDADFVHFIGSADAYAPSSRREIIEDWIAALGLADHVDPIHPPLHRVGAEMVWTGSIDTVGIQFHYPAGPGDPGEGDVPGDPFPEDPFRVVG
jgi:hypothetical protein